MPSYFKVFTKFWGDPYMDRCSDDAKLLALYLLTGPHRRSEGLFRLPKLYICSDLGWTLERLAEPFRQLLGEPFGEPGFMAYDEQAQVVLVRKALKYQPPENDNQVKAAVKHLEDLPDTPLTSEFRHLAERYSERLAKALPEGFGRPIPDPPTQALALALAQTQEQKIKTVVDRATPDRPGTLPTLTAIQEVWDAYLAARASVGLSINLRLTPKRRDKIRARLKLFPFEDVRDAGWGWTRDAWPDRRQHCDVVQIFRDDEQVEKFRNLWRDGPPRQVSKPAAQAMRTSVAMRARVQAREEVDRDLRGVGRSGGSAQHGLPAPAD